MIASRKVEKCAEACKNLSALGVKAVPVKCDMASDADIKNLVDTTMKEFGRIDILVNNVGASTDGPHVVDKPYDQIEYEVNVNYWSVIHCCKAVAPVMMERRWGRIVNLGSGVALVGRAGDSIYAASKAASDHFVRACWCRHIISQPATAVHE